MSATILKTFRYKVYDSTGTNYLGDLPNVKSDPQWTQDINSAGSAVTVTIAKAADNFSEGTLIAFRNRVQIYVFDNEAPTGTLIFQGFISNWTPYFVAAGEQVDINILGYGYELSQIILQNFQSQTSQDSFISLSGGGPKTAFAQLIQTGPGTTQVTGVDLIANDPFSDTITIAFYSVNNSTPNIPDSGILLANPGFVTIGSNVPQHYDMSGSPVALSPSTKYWMVVSVDIGPMTVGYNSTNTYPIGKTATKTSGVWSTDATKALYFILYPNNNQTQITFGANPQGVGFTIEVGLTNYQAQGGTLLFDDTTIDIVDGPLIQNLVVDSITILDFLNKCVALIPNGYWYVDQATNKIYVKVKANTPTYKLTLGKDLLSVQLQKYMENIVNTLLFSGGSGLFREYVKKDSVTLYGTRTGTAADSTITSTNQALADAYAAAYFQINAYPIVRSTIQIIDSAGGGFDIELLRPGDTLHILGSNGSHDSNWDEAIWDTDYWDYDIYDLNSMLLQITRIAYTPGVATVDIAMVPTQITKQTQVLATAVSNLQQASNPATPSVIYL